MTQKTQITIELIDDKSPYLKSVIELGDANKATLGFFSKGSFLDRADRRQVIIALDSQANFMGYLLYRASPSYDRISIIHLCINPSHRGKKLTKKLVDYLIEITQQYSGIGLTCRRDYGLDDMWSKLGFVAQYNKPAKTLGKQSTFWWLDYGKPNLFYSAAIQQRENKLSVGIDANIFFDLYADENLDNQESQLLLADWLQAELDLCVTDEIFNKINTIGNKIQRKHQHNFAKTFTLLPCQNQIFNTIHESVKTFLSQNQIDIHESDIRYLAKTIASDIHIFVTRDIHLLDIANEVYDNFRLSIIHPHNLILQLD
ncbi:MAG TPA: GNAT family N-acetyltransferase [Nodularia sp. (in: cyanobacteria)]|nr:GNAT family N-acetyltransferase [Nodularia sp. (in: cyanobacteria)]